MMTLKLKFECECHPEELAETCHKCQDVLKSCTVGVMDCPWAESEKSCKDITEEDWDNFIRGNLDMNSLFGR